jgi:hypothetical protein
MGFASQITDTVTLTNSTDTVVIKKLGHKAQRAAEMERQRLELVRLVSIGAGLIDVQNAVRKSLAENGGAEGVMKAIEADPLQKYDRDTLLEKGIVSWTLSDKPTPDQIADLDEPDADLLAHRIYDLFRPKTEAERKND